MPSTNELLEKYFKDAEHPYKTYERKIESILKESDTILDAGCGRTAPILKKFAGKVKTLIGVDLEEPLGDVEEVQYLKSNISSIDVPDNSVDIVISRAVLEHVQEPELVFEEISRLMKPGASFVFLVPNLGDYVSIASKIIPNRYHKSIVSKTEGREMDDVFPAYYKANTRSAITRLSSTNGLKIEEFEYLGQYPASFMFSPTLFRVATVYEKIISRYEFLGFLRGWILVRVTKSV